MDCQLSPFISTKIKVMKRGAWASLTTVISSLACWPCMMPVSRHSCEDPIKNRRFAILFLLNLAFQNKTAVALSDIIDVLNEDKSKFVVSEKDLEETISTEIEIAFMAGIPYVGRYINGKLYLQPTKGLNLKELEEGAPHEVINFLYQYSY